MDGFTDDGSASRPDDEPVVRLRRGLAPLVWLLAVCWLGLQGLGRAGVWLLTAVDEGTSAVARACGAATRAVLRGLGPLGRALQRLLAPLLRWLRLTWVWLGRRVFLAMVHPLGRFGRWLVRRSRPAVERFLAWTRRVAMRAEPLLHRLATALDGVERAAARLGAPLRRATVSVGRRLRPALASIARSVRTVGARWGLPRR
jgi:hypothetical protein